MFQPDPETQQLGQMATMLPQLGNQRYGQTLADLTAGNPEQDPNYSSNQAVGDIYNHQALGTGMDPNAMNQALSEAQQKGQQMKGQRGDFVNAQTAVLKQMTDMFTGVKQSDIDSAAQAKNLLTLTQALSPMLQQKYQARMLGLQQDAQQAAYLQSRGIREYGTGAGQKYSPEALQQGAQGIVNDQQGDMAKYISAYGQAQAAGAVANQRSDMAKFQLASDESKAKTRLTNAQSKNIENAPAPESVDDKFLLAMAPSLGKILDSSDMSDEDKSKYTNFFLRRMQRIKGLEDKVDPSKHADAAQKPDFWHQLVDNLGWGKNDSGGDAGDADAADTGSPKAKIDALMKQEKFQQWAKKHNLSDTQARKMLGSRLGG